MVLKENPMVDQRSGFATSLDILHDNQQEAAALVWPTSKHATDSHEVLVYLDYPPIPLRESMSSPSAPAVAPRLESCTTAAPQVVNNVPARLIFCSIDIL